MSETAYQRQASAPSTKLRVVVLTGRSSGCAARLTHYLARVPEAPFEIAGALLDTQQSVQPGHQRRRMRAWRRRGGTRYMLWRLWRHGLDRVLRHDPKSTYAHSIEDLGRQLGFPVLRVPDINDPSAQRALEELRADVGLSVENRIMGDDLIAIPRVGMINLHYGRIPDYRGIPPAFWELFHGADTMTVTVHRVDRLLDHGDVLGTRSVPVLADDDARTLFERALSVDYLAVEQVLVDLAAGDPRSQAVDWSEDRLHTLPGWGELRQIRRRRGRRIEYDGAARAQLDEIPAASVPAPSRPAVARDGPSAT